jgi:hypothetical protein
VTGYVCLRCRAYRRPRRELRGSPALELVLWLAFVVPGLVYATWRHLGARHVCAVCGVVLVDDEAPEARELAASESRGIAHGLTKNQRVLVATEWLSIGGGVGLVAVIGAGILFPGARESKLLGGVAVLGGITIFLHPLWTALRLEAAKRERVRRGK